MKTIYTHEQVLVAENDVVVASLPGIKELSIHEENEVLYDDYRVRISAEEISGLENELKSEMISRLWDACNEYQQNRIASLGVVNLGRKPEPNTKALANLQWVDGLWAEYKRKRDMITGNRIVTPLDEVIESEVAGGEIGLDIYEFGHMGDLPYSYFEAMEE